MKIKPLRFLLISLILLIAMGFGGSIQARAQRGLVVQITNTPPPGPTVVPILVSTPLLDGTVKHIIAGGQSLWSLSDAYGVPFEELLELNNLDPDVILNPGDEVIISPSYTPTSTPIGEPSSTPPPRYTHTPSSGTSQSEEKSFSPASPVPTETVQAEPRFRATVKDPLVIITAVIVSGGSLGAALYLNLRRRK
jgi:hypothetical protein